MNAHEIACRIARGVAPKLGKHPEIATQLVNKTDEKFGVKPQATRSLGDALAAAHLIAEIGTVAHFLYTVTPIMLEKWKMTRDVSQAEAAGNEAAKGIDKPEKVSDADLIMAIKNMLSQVS